MGKLSKKIRATDNPDLVWDDEETARRFIGSHLLRNDWKDRPEDMKKYYKELLDMPIEDLVKHRDTAGGWEFVPDEESEYAKPNNYTTKELYAYEEPFASMEDALDEIDKNYWIDKQTKEDMDNKTKSDIMRKIYEHRKGRNKVEDVDTSAIDEKDSGKGEEDDLDLYMKDLDDYMSKNKKGRDDIPTVTTRR